MRKFSPLRRMLKQASVVVCAIVLLVMGVTSLWFVDYAKGQPPIQMVGLLAGWFAIIVGAVVAAMLLIHNWHEGDATPHCQVCDYDLTGNVSGRCPECGTTIPNGDLTLSGRPSLFRNPFEALQDAATGRSRSTKGLVIYIAWALAIILAVSALIWIINHFGSL